MRRQYIYTYFVHTLYRIVSSKIRNSYIYNLSVYTIYTPITFYFPTQCSVIPYSEFEVFGVFETQWFSSFNRRAITSTLFQWLCHLPSNANCNPIKCTQESISTVAVIRRTIIQDNGTTHNGPPEELSLNISPPKLLSLQTSINIT